MYGHGLNKEEKCNWFCRNIKTIAAVATLLGGPALGSAMIAINYGIRSIQNDDWSFFKTGDSQPVDYPLTPSEEAILDVWNTKHFTPFFESLVQALNTAKTLQNGAEKAFLLESVLNQICIANSIANKPTPGLSNNAILSRSQLISLTLNEIVKEVNLQLIGFNKQQISIPENKINLDLGIAQTSSMVPCSSVSFQIKGGSVATIKDKQTLVDLTSNLSDAFVQGTASNTNVEPGAVISPKSSIMSFLMWPALAFIGYKIFKK